MVKEELYLGLNQYEPHFHLHMVATKVKTHENYFIANYDIESKSNDKGELEIREIDDETELRKYPIGASY